MGGKKRLRSRPCICNNGEQCQGMSMAFQLLDDPRGGHVELPPFSSNVEQYEFLFRMNELRNAYFRHLLCSAEEQQAAVLQVPAQMDHRFAHERQYAALHHFHPQVVREVAEASNTNPYTVSYSSASPDDTASPTTVVMSFRQAFRVPFTIKTSELRRLKGLHLTEQDRVYDLQGQATDEYFFVPNYPLDDAYRDLKQLSRAERSSSDIATSVYQQAQQAIQDRKRQSKSKRKSKMDRDNKHKQSSKQHDEKQTSAIRNHNSAHEEVEEEQQQQTTIAINQKQLQDDDTAKEESRPTAAQTLHAAQKLSPTDATASAGTSVIEAAPKSATSSTNTRASLLLSSLNNNKSSTDTDDDDDSDEDLGDSTATLHGSGSITGLGMSSSVSEKTASETTASHIRSRNTLDASDSTVFGTTSRNYSITLDASDSTFVGTALRNYSITLDASDSTVIGRLTQSNLDASAMSIHVTDPNFQKSDSTMFHASDLTVRASGAGPVTQADENNRVFHASDETIPASNTTDGLGSVTPSRQLSDGDLTTEEALTPEQVAKHFPLEELPRRQSSIPVGTTRSSLPSCESPNERKTTPRSYRTKAQSLTAYTHPSAMINDLPFNKDLPRRQSDGLPTPRGAQSRSESISSMPALETPPQRRFSSMRDKIRQEVGNSRDLDSNSLSMAATSPQSAIKGIGPSKVGVGSGTAVATAGDRRFRSVSAANKVQDSSPSTPRRMHSIKDMKQEEQNSIQQTLKTDESPSTPKRMLSDRELVEYEQPLNDVPTDPRPTYSPRMESVTEVDAKAPKGNILQESSVDDSRDRSHSSRSRSKDDCRRRSIPVDSTLDSSAKPRRRSTTALSLSLLDEKIMRFNTATRRSRSGSSQGSTDGQPSRQLPARTLSASMATRPRRRKSHFLPRPCKSDSSTASSRRRSDTSALSRRSTMTDSSKKSMFGGRRIDTTRRAMEQFSNSFVASGDDHDDPITRRRLPRRTRSSDGTTSWGHSPPKQRESPRRSRSRDAASFESSSLPKLRRMPRRTKSSDGMESRSSSPAKQRRMPGRIKSSDGEGPRSLSPRDNTRRERRQAIVETETRDLLKSLNKLRRTGSIPGRSEPKGGLRRTRTDLSPTPRGRWGNQSLPSIDGTSKSRPMSLSPLRSPKSELSSMIEGKNLPIKRIDSSMRAMKRFVIETGTSATSSGRSRSRSPRRAWSRLSSQRTRSASPRPTLSPARTSSKSSGGNVHDDSMNMSSPVIMCNGSDPTKLNRSSIFDEMNSSSPAILSSLNNSSPAILSQAPDFTRRTGSCPTLSVLPEVLANEVADSCTKSSRAQSPPLLTNDQDLPNRNSYAGFGEFTRSTLFDNMNNSSPAVLSRASDSRRRTGSRPTLSTLPEALVVDLPIGKLLCTTVERVSIIETSEANEKLRIVDSFNETTPSNALTGSLLDTTEQPLQVNKQTVNGQGMAAEAEEAKSKLMNDQSLKLKDIGKVKNVGNKGVIPTDFNFSYPLPCKSDRKKGVDWKSLGLDSSFPPEQEMRRNDLREPTRFSLPLRLMGRKIREELLTEVVVVAHRRQTMVPKKPEISDLVRQQSEEVMKEMMEVAQEKQKHGTSFAEDVEKTANASLKRDRAGQLDAYLGRMTVTDDPQGQGSSKISLDLMQVFQDSQDWGTSPVHGSTRTPVKAADNQGSSLSLSLRRVFEDSHDDSPEEKSAKTSDWELEKLRALFPFRNIKEKRRNGSSSLSSASASDSKIQDKATDSITNENREKSCLRNDKIFGANKNPRLLVEAERRSFPPMVDRSFVDKLPTLSEEEKSLEDQSASTDGSTYPSISSEMVVEDNLSAPPLLVLMQPEEEASSVGSSNVPIQQTKLQIELPKPLCAKPIPKDSANCSGKQRTHSASEDLTKTPKFEEFHLSFPPSQTASRALPSADDCLAGRRKSSPAKFSSTRSFSSTANLVCGQLCGEDLDRKIDDADIHHLPGGKGLREIVFVPEFAKFTDMKTKISTKGQEKQRTSKQQTSERKSRKEQRGSNLIRA